MTTNGYGVFIHSDDAIDLIKEMHARLSQMEVEDISIPLVQGEMGEFRVHAYMPVKPKQLELLQQMVNGRPAPTNLGLPSINSYPVHGFNAPGRSRHKKGKR